MTAGLPMADQSSIAVSYGGSVEFGSLPETKRVCRRRSSSRTHDLLEDHVKTYGVGSLAFAPSVVASLSTLPAQAQETASVPCV